MNGKNENETADTGNFCNRNLKKFPGTRKIKNFRHLIFSFNPIDSFRTLSTLQSLVYLDLTATKIKSLEYIPSLPKLNSILLQGTPFSRYKLYRLMCIVAFDPSIRSIDNRAIATFEKIINSEEKSKIQNLLVEGWIIVSVKPIVMAYPRLQIKAPLSSILCDEYSKVQSKSDVIIANEILTELPSSIVTTITQDESVISDHKDSYTIVRYVQKQEGVESYEFDEEANMNPLQEFEAPPPAESPPRKSKSSRTKTTTNETENLSALQKSDNLSTLQQNDNLSTLQKSEHVELKNNENVEESNVPAKEEAPKPKKKKIVKKVRKVVKKTDDEVHIQPAPPLDPHLTDMINESLKDSLKENKNSSEELLLMNSNKKLPAPPIDLDVEEVPVSSKDKQSNNTNSENTASLQSRKRIRHPRGTATYTYTNTQENKQEENSEDDVKNSSLHDKKSKHEENNSAKHKTSLSHESNSVKSHHSKSQNNNIENSSEEIDNDADQEDNGENFKEEETVDEYTYVTSEYDLSSEEAHDVPLFKLPETKKPAKPVYLRFVHKVLMDVPPKKARPKRGPVDTRPKQLYLDPIRYHPLKKAIPGPNTVPCDFITNTFDGEDDVKERHLTFVNGDVFTSADFFEISDEEEDGHTYTRVMDELWRERDEIKQKKERELNIEEEKENLDDQEFETDVDHMYCSPFIFAPDRYDKPRFVDPEFHTVGTSDSDDYIPLAQRKIV